MCSGEEAGGLGRPRQARQAKRTRLGSNRFCPRAAGPTSAWSITAVITASLRASVRGAKAAATLPGCPMTASRAFFCVCRPRTTLCLLHAPGHHRPFAQGDRTPAVHLGQLLRPHVGLVHEALGLRRPGVILSSPLPSCRPPRYRTLGHATGR